MSWRIEWHGNGQRGWHIFEDGEHIAYLGDCEKSEVCKLIERHNDFSELEDYQEAYAKLDAALRPFADVGQSMTQERETPVTLLIGDERIEGLLVEDFCDAVYAI